MTQDRDPACRQAGLTAILMASGFSRRMGVNKLLLPLGGSTVIGQVLETVSSAGYDGVVVVSCWPEILTLAAEKGFFPVMNTQAAQGQSSSIRLGLQAALDLAAQGRLPASAAATFFTGDQIFLSSRLLRRLKAAWQARPEALVFPCYGPSPGPPGIFPADCFQELLALRGEEGGRTVARRHSDRLLTVPAPEIGGRDFDRPEEWRLAARLWAEQHKSR